MKRFLLILIIFTLVFGMFFHYEKNTATFTEEVIAENNGEDLLEEIVSPIFNEEIIPEINEPKIVNISLLAVGDIMFHSPQFRAAYNPQDSTYDFTPVFKHVKKYIEEAHIALGNFETVTGGKERGFSGFPRFNSPEETLLAIKDAGFDVLSTANNHSLDRGKEGIISTLHNIEKYGLKNIGTYKEKDTPIYTEEIEEVKIGFLSYTYGLNGLDSLLTKEELSYMVNLIHEEKIKEDIEKTKSIGVDLIVVFIHWGNEYQRQPSNYQIELGRKMVEWGANIILGSHPHVIQKSEIINYNEKDNFIIYSMGNFLSNQRRETMGNSFTEDGVMVKIEIEKDFSKNEAIIKEITYIPTWVHRYRENGKLCYEIIPLKDLLEGDLDINLTKEVFSRMEKSYNDTQETIKGN